MKAGLDTIFSSHHVLHGKNQINWLEKGRVLNTQQETFILFTCWWV